MKKVIGALFSIFFTTFIMAQDGWTEYYSSAGIKVMYRYADCHDDANGIHQQKVLLRFENTTNSNIGLTFSRVSDYGNNSNISEAACELNIASHSFLEGDCSSKNKCLFFFAKHLNMDGRKLRGFELINIKTSKEQQ